MKAFLVILLVVPLMLILGCDGDGGGDAVVADGGAAETDGDSSSPGTWVMLIETGGTIDPGTNFIGGANPPSPGTLRCVYTWTAPPTNLTCWLQQRSGGTGESAHETGASGLVVTTHVEGGGWSPYITNSFTMPVYVHVAVDFLAD